MGLDHSRSQHISLADIGDDQQVVLPTGAQRSETANPLPLLRPTWSSCSMGTGLPNPAPTCPPVRRQIHARATWRMSLDIIAESSPTGLRFGADKSANRSHASTSTAWRCSGERREHCVEEHLPVP